MKYSTLLIGLLLSVGFLGCSLEEEPPFLSNANVYADASNATAALIGIYESFAEYNFYGNAYMRVVNRNSGFFITSQGGQNNQNPNNTSICSLKPLAGDININNMWKAHYKTISRANDAIQGVGDPGDDEVLQEVVGHAYFVRAYAYFNLVRLFGDVPLRLEPATSDNIHMPKTDAKTIYDQVIDDAIQATQYMNGSMGSGFPKVYAANMLLAKIYMHLATAPADIQNAGQDYWQLAYEQAVQVYGQYELVADFTQLWNDSGENTAESIFEIQFSEQLPSTLYREWTAPGYTFHQSWGLSRINAEVVDRHMAAYPDDPRIAATFLSAYTGARNGWNLTHYPEPNRQDRNAVPQWGQAFPYNFKACVKDVSPTNTSWFNDRNWVVYRYGDLLLMLAEISNELQNGQELDYVTELLARVGQSPQAAYSNGQEAFREAIMAEYTFELMSEGHDWYNNRRRGYNWFRTYTIDPHNNYDKFTPKYDVTFETAEETVMFLPFPADEINTNEAI
ncbi:MAG: RagB/SusD family nutrient uptake outer membrane protein [Saprospiraceae bacterium]|nr:RagB/SusD family nutrient uptake outer membrane protein [Saprospiraceae bacterium]